ncbi:hypothetical protein Patl1_04280 [Pistacia atlantica]|uniref:Uncharacterized protein n=1 Tax=Pistacia atlantica TaxID=434234 RepID=A0ACC1BT86_9ROSI|nr:hypothetical protein Patl1_04280 [Pistacia atlantica]
MSGRSTLPPYASDPTLGYGFIIDSGVPMTVPTTQSATGLNIYKSVMTSNRGEPGLEIIHHPPSISEEQTIPSVTKLEAFEMRNKRIIHNGQINGVQFYDELCANDQF